MEKEKPVISHVTAIPSEQDLESTVPSAPCFDDFHLDEDPTPQTPEAKREPPDKTEPSNAISASQEQEAPPDPSAMQQPQNPSAKTEHSSTAASAPTFHTVSYEQLGRTLNVMEPHVLLRRDLENVGNDIAAEDAIGQPNVYTELAQEVKEMEPHVLLQRDLDRMRMNTHPSAPPDVMDPSAPPDVMDPSAPLDIMDPEALPDTMDPMALPHAMIDPVPMTEDERAEEQILVDADSHEMELSSITKIQPFTEHQLKGLYCNPELDHNSEFVAEFLSTQGDVEKSELHELLTNYLRVRASLLSAEKSYEAVRLNAKEYEEAVWKFHSKKISDEGFCEDRNQVVAVHDYKVAEFNADASENLSRSLKEMKELLIEDHSLHAYKAEISRLKIEDFIFKVIARVHESAESVQTSNELKLSISVLFSFQRRLISDERFLRDTRAWLDQLVAVLLDSATLGCHLFLLNHIMRCPAGVGKWATGYIQPVRPSVASDDDFENPFLNHLLTVLATVLLPVQQREDFLRELKVTASPVKLQQKADNIWVVLDSEGEEDEDPEHSWSLLRENDLVAILNQIPIDSMFRYILKIDQRDGKDVYDPTQSSEYSFLKLFAFSTRFVYLMKEGLATFNTPRFRQFAKRLGRLIRHTVQYVSDHWEAFKRERQRRLDPSMFRRIQVEYDHFFLRATKCIFSSQKLGAWQYLAVIPYGTISISMLWRIFYVLHLDYREDYHKDFGEDIKDWKSVFSDPDLVIQFEEKLIEADDSESIFLLTAFANMAISRDAEMDRDFIVQASLDLFHVGFVNSATAEHCSKGTRDLLVNVSQKHPFIMSCLVQELKEEEKLGLVGTKSFFLLKDLPFALWKPTSSDIETLSSWLTSHPLHSLQSQLARIIFSRMNWTFRELPWPLHQRLAVLIVDAAFKFAPDSVSSGFLEESMRQVSSIAAAVRQTPEQLFNVWAWETVSKLHLHAMEQCDLLSQRAVASSPEAFKNILDFDLDTTLETLAKAVTAKNPLACFVALKLTQTGHSIPEISERGLNELRILAASGRYDHVMECLLVITPLFINVVPGLETIGGFGQIMQTIIGADQTYFKMAKDLIVSEFPGPVMKEFGNMLLKQISLAKRYGLVDSIPIIEMWFRICTRLPSWNKDRNVLFILDLICKEAFFNKNAKDIIKSSIRALYEEATSKSSGGFMSWISSSKTPFSLLPSSSPDFPWFAFFVLEVEEEKESSVRLWKELVVELKAEGVYLEKALKSAAANLKMHTPNSNSLPIYRWCQQMLDTPIDHPLLVLFAQKFFSYFLCRPPPTQEGYEYNGVGLKFFEGLMNTMYLNKVKTKLQNTADHYADEETEVQAKLGSIFHTMQIWLDDPLVLDCTLHANSLAPKYCPQKLALLLAEDKTLWWEYLDYDEIQHTRTASIDEWNKLHFRQSKNPARNQQPPPELPPKERIVQRLKSYESSLPPPRFSLNKSPVPTLNDRILIDPDALIAGLEAVITAIKDYVQNFNVQNLEFGALTCAYMELLPNLYENKDTEVLYKIACPGTVGPKKEKYDCTGTAPILLQFSEAKKNEAVGHKIAQNRESFQGLSQRMLQTLPIRVSAAMTFLEQVVKHVLRMYSRHLGRGSSSDSLSLYHSLGVTLFYSLADLLTEEMSQCPPIRHLLSSLLETLGQSVIAENPEQCLQLVRRVVQRPLLSQYLTTAFTPNVADSNTFIELYDIIGGIPAEEGSLAFVLLSKMSVDDWLRRCRPKLSLRSRVINLVARALKETGQVPPADRQMVHGLHRHHLTTLIMYDFPEHYGEVVGMLLALAESQELDPEVWIDVLNALMKKSNGVKMTDSPAKWSDVFKEFASNQQHIKLDEIHGCSRLLSHHFAKERREVGLHGLFTKYQRYATPFAMYLTLQGHLTIVVSLKNDKGSPANLLVTQLWNHLRDLFNPWLCPLMGADRQQASAWIQQLAESQQVLLPWAPGDGKWATQMAASFAHAIVFLQETVPAPRPAIAHLWEYYCTYFAHSSVKDYVLAVIHHALLPLPWSAFIPTQQDIELMVRVIDTFLPPCHGFLGRVFVEIPWTKVVGQEGGPRIIPALLRLIVKLAAEPQIRQIGRLLGLVREAESFPWWLVDFSSFESLIQWYVMSVDCKVLLNHENRHPLDAAVFRLLQISAGHFQPTELGAPHDVGDVTRKRHIFVRCCVRLLVSCGSKQKGFLANHQDQLKFSVKKLIDDIEIVNITAVPPARQLPDCLPLVKEYLLLVNASQSSPLPSVTLAVLLNWIHDHTGQSPVLIAILQQVCTVVTHGPSLSRLIEAALEAYFIEVDDEESTSRSWPRALGMINFPDQAKMRDVLEVAVKEGHILVLFAYLKKRQPLSKSITEELVLLTSLQDWLRHIAISEKSEPKLPLLYHELLFLILRQWSCGTDDRRIVKHLISFIEVLHPLTQDSGWNILGAIGLTSHYQLSPRARFLALALKVFLLSQITAENKIRRKVDAAEGGENESSASPSTPTDPTPVQADLHPVQVDLQDSRLQLVALKNSKSHLGLTDLIDWALDNIQDETNDIKAVHEFIDYLVIDRLYVEKYLKLN